MEALSHRLCKENEPQAVVLKVKLFTASISAKLSPRGQASLNDQTTYLRALEEHCSLLEIIKGKFFPVPGSYYGNTKPIDFSKKYKVIRPEEKCTDVNIALHMLADATDGIYDQQVLFTNDSDCAPILEMIKQRHPNIRLGVIPPIMHSGSEGKERYASSEIRQATDWCRKPLRESLLLECQLPEKVSTRKKTFRKPDYWK